MSDLHSQAIHTGGERERDGGVSPVSEGKHTGKIISVSIYNITTESYASAQTGNKGSVMKVCWTSNKSFSQLAKSTMLYTLLFRSLGLGRYFIAFEVSSAH